MYNITGGKDLTLQEVNRVSEVVTSLADPSCNIIFGEAGVTLLLYIRYFYEVRPL